MNIITDIFQVIFLHLRSLSFKVDLKGKSLNFETEWTLCYSKYVVFHFQPLQCRLYVEVMNCNSFLLNKEESFDKHSLPSSANDKRIYGNYRVKIHSGKCSAYMVHWNSMKITISVFWCPNRLAYVIAQLVCIYTT